MYSHSSRKRADSNVIVSTKIRDDGLVLNITEKRWTSALIVLGLVLGAVADFLQVALARATGEVHVVDRAAAMNLGREPFREGVHHTHTHAVKSPGNLVGILVEFSAGVQRRHSEFYAGQLFNGVEVDWNTAPVIEYSDRLALVHGDVHCGAVTSHRLIDGVVHNLVHEVMEPTGGGGPDVHARAFSNSLQAFENLNLLGGVLGAVFFFGH